MTIATLLTISIAIGPMMMAWLTQNLLLPSIFAADQRLATTVPQSASLWAIRIALLAMFVVLVAETQGQRRTERLLAILWFAGALLSFGHSIGAIATFHQGSQANALESTAQQTEALLGIRFGAGLFANYLFVLVWLVDAAACLLAPTRYAQMPNGIRLAINAFLIFIAINGAIVFASGWTRWIGILCVVIALLAIAKHAWWQRLTASHR